MEHSIALTIAAVTQPLYIAMVFVGVIVGAIIGILPGLGSSVAIAILLPFIYGVNEVAALGMLLGAAAVTVTADTITAVLVGGPGSVGGWGTVMDGYPMAKKGQAGRALGGGFLASF